MWQLQCNFINSYLSDYILIFNKCDHFIRFMFISIHLLCVANLLRANMTLGNIIVWYFHLFFMDTYINISKYRHDTMVTCCGICIHFKPMWKGQVVVCVGVIMSELLHEIYLILANNEHIVYGSECYVRHWEMKTLRC